MKLAPCLIPLFLLGCLLGISCGRQASRQETQSKPNVLFIAIDDLNDWIEPLGQFPISRTPNFTRLASMSMTFTNAHCSSPACSPSRISVMTGIHPATSGIMNNIPGDGPEWRKNPVLSEVQTMEQFFQAQGYETLAGGKIYHTLPPPRTIVNQADPNGWDFYYPSVHIPAPYQIRAPEEVIYPADTVGERPSPNFTWGPLPVPDEKMSDYHIADWAIHELSRRHDKPLFLAVGLVKPHDPWEVPQKYFDQYPLDTIPDVITKKDDVADAHDHGRRQIHNFIVRNKQTKKVLQSYLASVAFTDAMLGRLLDGFENSRLKDNTIVVVWSDHGMHMGEKENWEKFSLWERSTRVPLFIMAPGHSRTGSKTDATVSLLDLYPTLAELIGENIPPHCEGTSLVPLFSDSSFQRDPVVSAYSFLDKKGYAVRSDSFRYIYYPDSGLEELYNLKSDPHEWTNVAYQPDFKAKVSEHREHLLKKVPGLIWKNQPPRGYTVSKDGAVRKADFVPMEQLEYKNEWH